MLPMGKSRMAHAAAAMKDELFVFGGLARTGLGGRARSGVEVYQPAANYWLKLRPLPYRLAFAAAVALEGWRNRVLLKSTIS